jgi:hypothetical protein
MMRHVSNQVGEIMLTNRQRVGVTVLTGVLALAYWAITSGPTAQAQSRWIGFDHKGYATVKVGPSKGHIERYEDPENKIVCYVLEPEVNRAMSLSCVKK